MKKTVLSFILSAFVTGSLFTPTITQAQKPIDVFYHGHKITFNVDPIIDYNSDSTLVEFRPIFEEFGLSIGYDANNNAVTGDNGKLHIVFKIGEKYALVNNQIQNLPVAPQIVNGHTIIPLRFISEAVGEKVDWNGEDMTVNISDQQQPAKVIINGKDIQLNQNLPSVRVFGKVYAPYTDILRAFMGDQDKLSFNPNDNSVTITHNGVSTTISEYFYNDKGMLPVDEMANIFNATSVDNGDSIQVTTNN